MLPLVFKTLRCCSMTDIDLMTDEQLVEILRNRMEAKEVAYLFAWGDHDGEHFWYATSLDFEHLNIIYEHCMEDFEGEIYNSDNWNPTKDELLQWEADSEEVDDEED